MKKFLFALLIMAIGTSASAQQATLIPLATGDTISTSSSKDTTSKVINVTGGYSTFGIQVVCRKLSGTVAGKAYLYGSLDGTNYVVTDSSAAFSDQTTNTAVFTKTTPLPYTYYKIQVREADGGANTTQSYIPRFYYVFRKYQTQ